MKKSEQQTKINDHILNQQRLSLVTCWVTSVGMIAPRVYRYHVSIYVFIYRRLACVVLRAPSLVQWAQSSPLSSLSAQPGHKLTLEQLDSSRLLLLHLLLSSHNEVSLLLRHRFFVFVPQEWVESFCPSDQDRVSDHQEQVGTVQISGPECIIVQGKAVSCQWRYLPSFVITTHIVSIFAS